jgi:hypothetical protein
VIGVANGRVRGRLADGGEVVVDSDRLSPPMQSAVTETEQPIRDSRTGDVFGLLPTGTTLTVLAIEDQRSLVRLESGRVGYIDS